VSIALNIVASAAVKRQVERHEFLIMRKKLVFIILTTSLLEYAHAQKGDKSISIGPLVSFPLANHRIPNYKTGIGIEVTGQYNMSDKSSLLLQAGLSSFGAEQLTDYHEKSLTLISLKGGYKYDITSSGFFIAGLLGTDIEPADEFSSISFTIGAGKRFAVKNNYFIDAGIDFIGGDTENRVNIKVAFSVFQKSKK